MRNLIRILAGTALVGALAFVSTPPVSATHDAGTGTNWPLGPHEEMPEPKVVAYPNMACAVTGSVTVLPIYAPGGPQHSTVIPEVNDDPSHSHYTFLDTAIICLDASKLAVEIFDVDATGGNDGHMFDIYDGADPACPAPVGGPNCDPLELDCLDSALPLDVDPGSKPTCQGDDHDFNDHHGSVNESAWSHSSGYVDHGIDDGTCNDQPKVPTHKNKGNITATGTLSKIGPNLGWVKYVRVGATVHAWGSFYAGPYSVNKGGCANFSASLLFTPTDPTVPGSPFLLNGLAVIGTGWV